MAGGLSYFSSGSSGRGLRANVSPEAAAVNSEQVAKVIKPSRNIPRNHTTDLYRRTQHKKTHRSAFGVLACASSHPPAALIESVAVDNRLDVSTRCREIDLLKKLAFRYLGNAVSTAPPLGTTGAGVVLRQSERNWIGLMVPVCQGAMQIPGAGFQI